MRIQDHKVLSLFLTLAVLALSLSAMPRVSADSFVHASSMRNDRSNHTATLLLNGKVLVAGGWGGGASAELYDPASDAWTVTGRLHLARAGATATLLPNGKVLVAGGEQRDGSFWSTTSAELYDPATGTWTLTSPMNHARVFHTATLLPSGKVLVGPESPELFDPDRGTLFDPDGGTWTEIVSPSNIGRQATLLPSGRVFFPFASGASFYDPGSGSWTTTSAPGQSYGDTTLLHHGEVLVLGGSDGTTAALYDYNSGTWTPTSSMLTMRGDGTMTVLPNGKVLLAGGSIRLATGGWRYSVSSAELYDPIPGTWTATASMTIGRSEHTATLLPNGKVLFAGGRISGVDPQSSAELYVPDSDGLPPSITILHHSNQILSFSWRGVGILEQSDSLTASNWQLAPGQENPQIIPTIDPMKFYRLRFNQ